MSISEVKTDRRIFGFLVNGNPDAINNTLQFNNSQKRFEWVQDVSLLLNASNHDNFGDKELISGIGVKGAWVELEPNSPRQYNWLELNVHNQNTSNIYLIDIGIGAIGFETVLIPDILQHIDLTGMNIIETIHNIKTQIPAGTRISARVQSVLATDTVNISVIGTG